MFHIDSIPKQKERILAKNASGTLVLLDLESGEYYTLDEVGSRVWALCDGIRNVSEITSIINQEYDAPADVIQADVLELLEDMAGEKLVVESN